MEDLEEKKIVFINQATGYLTIDIINAFASYFNKVALISGSIRIQDIELNKKVNWSKIIKYNRGNPIKKFLSWLIGSFQIFFLLLFKYREYEVFYFTVPPTACFSSLFLSNRFSILVFDVYPDVLKGYSIKDSGFLYKTWIKINKKLFKKAHRIYTISETMAELLASYIDKYRIIVIPLWSGIINARPVPKEENPWLIELGLQDKFIVQYSGNIGFTHNLKIIFDIAKELINIPELHFLIIGRGEKFKDLSSLILKNELSNCTLLGFQPDNVIKYSLAAADIGIVILDSLVAKVSLPSKIYNLQALGIPILGITSEDSELNRHLKRYGNGICLKPEKSGEIVKFILKLMMHHEIKIELAANSLKASQQFTVENAKKYFQTYISEVF